MFARFVAWPLYGALLLAVTVTAAFGVAVRVTVVFSVTVSVIVTAAIAVTLAVIVTTSVAIIVDAAAHTVAVTAAVAAFLAVAVPGNLSVTTTLFIAADGAITITPSPLQLPLPGQSSTLPPVPFVFPVTYRFQHCHRDQ